MKHPFRPDGAASNQPIDPDLAATADQPSPHDDELLTIAEVSAYLKISRRTAWRWCKSGRLPAAKAGRQWRISRKALAKFLKQPGNYGT